MEESRQYKREGVDTQPNLEFDEMPLINLKTVKVMFQNFLKQSNEKRLKQNKSIDMSNIQVKRGKTDIVGLNQFNIDLSNPQITTNFIGVKTGKQNMSKGNGK